MERLYDISIMRQTKVTMMRNKPYFITVIKGQNVHNSLKVLRFQSQAWVFPKACAISVEQNTAKHHSVGKFLKIFKNFRLILFLFSGLKNHVQLNITLSDNVAKLLTFWERPTDFVTNHSLDKKNRGSSIALFYV